MNILSKKRVLLILSFIFSVIANGQDQNCRNDIRKSPIRINNKISYETLSKDNSFIIRLIDLSKKELKDIDSLSTLCDTLKITGFTFSNFDCGVDHIVSVKSNKISDFIKKIIVKECCNLIWFDKIKATGRSGSVYDLSSFRINVIE